MGTFDSVVTKCPYCRKELEFQSKAGDCSFLKYKLNSVPAEIATDLVGTNEDGIPYDIVECCGHNFTLTANISRVQMNLVEWHEEDEEDDELLY